MKIPWYETSPGALMALLATRRYVQCDLYTFHLSGAGGTLRYATSDLDVSVSGNVWSARTVLFYQDSTRPTAHWKIGLDVDTWAFTVMPRPVDPLTGEEYPDKIGGQPWLSAARAGALDGAEVQVDRAFFAAWPSAEVVRASPVGVVTIFYGRMAEVDASRTQASIKLNSHLELLSTSVPRNLYQAPCGHTLFDSGCGLSAAAYAVTGTVGTGSGKNIVVSDVAAPSGSGTYALGRVTMTSGLNNGVGRMVRGWAPGAFTLLSPFPYPVQAGDTFIAHPGCDKSLYVAASAVTIPTASYCHVSVPGGHATGDFVNPDFSLSSKKVFYSNVSGGTVYLTPIPGGMPSGSGTYTCTASGDFVFHPADSGRMVAIMYQTTTGTYLSGYTIPPVSTSAVYSSPNYAADFGVIDSSTGVPFTPVVSPTIPLSGQYAVNAATGLYTFAAADMGRAVIVNYQATAQSAGMKGCGAFGNVVNFGGAPHIPAPETGL